MYAGSYYTAGLQVGGAVGTEYSTTNRVFLFDTDPAASLVLSSGAVANWNEYTGSTTYSWYQNYAGARLLTTTRFGRRMMYVDSFPSAVTANTALQNVIAQLNGAQTMFWVWSPSPDMPTGNDSPMWSGYNRDGGPDHRFVYATDGTLYLYRTYNGTEYNLRFNKPAGWVWNADYIYMLVLRYNTNGTINLFVNGNAWTSTNLSGTTLSGTVVSAAFTYVELSYEELGDGTVNYGGGTWGAIGKYSVALSDADCTLLNDVKKARYPGGQP